MNPIIHAPSAAFGTLGALGADLAGWPLALLVTATACYVVATVALLRAGRRG